MPASVSSRATAPAEGFRNWKLIGVEIIASALALYAFLGWAPELLGWVGLVAAVPIVLSLGRELGGVAINDRGLSFLRGRPAGFPILPLGRRLEVGAAGLRELRVMEPWHRIEVVRIEGWFGAELLVFQSRAQRVRFMSVFQKTYPDVPIYKAKTRRG
jgi:hypothetical protein